jgi:DnaJ like chaperone protein
MSIWERLAAATFESSPGASLTSTLFGRPSGLSDNGKTQSSDDNALPFTVGMITLGAKMAKADGVVTKDEVHAFRKAFNLSNAEMKQAAHAFNIAKQDAAGYEIHADEIVSVFKGDRKLLGYTLDGLFHIAKADGDVPPAEEVFLGRVAKRFGFTDAEFAVVKARHLGANARNPYDVLGVNSSTSDVELTSTYHRLVVESQPNEFISRGMPAEFVSIAKSNLAAIEEAYKAIAKERGLETQTHQNE